MSFSLTDYRSFVFYMEALVSGFFLSAKKVGILYGIVRLHAVKRYMKHKNAFTLIELLVVISVIAVLIALLIPALRLAKRQAHRVVCCKHQKQLTLAWLAYAGDHDGRLVSGSEDHTWVSQKESSSVAQVIKFYDEKGDLHQGLLWPYVRSEAIYKCPAARMHKLRSESRRLGYGISRGVYYLGSGIKSDSTASKLQQIKSSG